MFSRNSLKNFHVIYFIINREIAFLVKSLKSELYQNGSRENIFKYVPIITML